MIRKMGDHEIIQRTKDGFFNATLLATQWNNTKGARKETNAFLSLKSTKEFIESIEIDIQETSYVKSKASRGKNAGTWMHPFLFIDFAMWINPKFKLQVIKFVHDQLIEFRHDAADHYKELSAAAVRFNDIDFGKMAKGLNYVAFGRHQKGIRQSATPDQLKELNVLQKQLAFACDMGYITSFENLLEEMRKLFHQRYRLAG